VEPESEVISAQKAVLQSMAEQLTRECAGPQDYLGGARELLKYRGRFFSWVGERYPLTQPDGMGIIDALDEQLVRSINVLLSSRKAGEAPVAEPGADDELAQVLKKIPELPQYPVGYMVLFVMTKIFEAVEATAPTRRGAEFTPLCEAGLRELHRVSSAFLKTRETPLLRHFSDVSREYTVVARLSCTCGTPKHLVESQALHTGDDGARFDRLEVKCDACGKRRSVDFPLPHFTDLGEKPE
jgi:hypothetical protein